MASAYLAAPQFTAEDEQKEQASLTKEQKKEAEDDLYGRYTYSIDADVKNSGLRDLQDELEKIPSDQKERYLEARRRCPSITSNKDDLLLFLRSERFNAVSAARRVVTYWDRRTELFGPEKAFKPLTRESSLRDNEDDCNALSMNFCLLLPGKDKAGRSILCLNFGKKKPNYKRDSLLRVVWCMCHEALRDSSNSTRGDMVVVLNTRDTHIDDYDRKLQRNSVTAFREIIPMLIRGMHLCHPTQTLMSYALPVLRYTMGQAMRLRFVVHRGNEEQVLEKLAKFGIMKESLPRNLGGDVDFEEGGVGRKRKRGEEVKANEERITTC